MDTFQNHDWQRKSIKDGCESIVDCINKTAPRVNFATPFKMLRTTNVKNGWIDVNNVGYVTEEVYKKWTRRQVPQIGDVILTREAPLGEVGMLRTNDKIFLGQRLMSFRTNQDKLDNKFLYYSFLSHDLISQIRSLGSGSTVEHMRVPDAEKLTILAPEIETQRTISAILGAYDDLIENNEKRIKILEEMAQLLYTEWFVKFKFPGYEKVKMVDSGTEYGMIPEGWEVKKVKDSFNFLGGGTPSRIDETYWMDGSIDWYTPTDLSSNWLFSDRSGEKITDQGLKHSSAKLFPEFSVMMTSRATIGRISINTKPATTNQGFIICLPNNDAPLYFLYFWLKSRVRMFIDLGTGVTFKEITKGNFGEIKFLVPAKNICDEYSDKSTKIGLEILNLQRCINNLSKIRDILIPQLITGKKEII